MSTMLTRLTARVSEEPATQHELDRLAKNAKIEKSDPIAFVSRHSRLRSIVFILVPLHKTRCGPNNFYAASILFPHRKMIRPKRRY